MGLRHGQPPASRSHNIMLSGQPLEGSPFQKLPDVAMSAMKSIDGEEVSLKSIVGTQLALHVFVFGTGKWCASGHVSLSAAGSTRDLSKSCSLLLLMAWLVTEGTIQTSFGALESGGFRLLSKAPSGRPQIDRRPIAFWRHKS